MIEHQHTVRSVAEKLQVTERSVREFIAKGDLGATKVRHWRISEAQLQQFLNRRSAQQKDEFGRLLSLFLYSAFGSLLPDLACFRRCSMHSGNRIFARSCF